MAIGNGILRKISGSVGDLNYRVNRGTQILAVKATNVANPKTRGQMSQRTKWANIVTTYQAANGALKDGFENKASNLSDYNMFMSVNLQATPVYLTRQEAALKAAVAAPYKITQGSLPSIIVTGTDATAYTDIALGDLQIGESTTVAQLARAIVTHNDNWEYGDQLSYFSFQQRINANEGYPYLVCVKSKVELRLDDDSLLWNVVPEYGFASRNGFLGHGQDIGQGAFAWVHSRKSNARTLVSTQILVLNNDFYAEYITEDKFYQAALSYGVSGTVFLRPDQDNGATASSGSGSEPDTQSSSGSDNGSDTGGGSNTGDSQGGGTDTGGSESGGGSVPSGDDSGLGD